MGQPARTRECVREYASWHIFIFLQPVASRGAHNTTLDLQNRFGSFAPIETYNLVLYYTNIHVHHFSIMFICLVSDIGAKRDSRSLYIKRFRNIDRLQLKYNLAIVIG